jgi:hypothetical protein
MCLARVLLTASQPAILLQVISVLLHIEPRVVERFWDRVIEAYRDVATQPAQPEDDDAR